MTPVTDVPRLEAEVLLAHVLQTSRTWLLAHLEHPLTTDQLTSYQTLVHRRASHYPLPYLIGRVEFHGLEFEVTPDVLIPRPETETLVDLALARRPATAIDVGAGTGCIAVSLAVHLPEATIWAVEISPAALAVARRNAERHGVASRVQLVAGDLLSPCRGPFDALRAGPFDALRAGPFDALRAGPFDALRAGPPDLIVSNPPYVSASEYAALPPSIREYEPRLALDGGPDGLTVIRRLLAQAAAALKPSGALLVEIGANQGEAVSHLARDFFPQATIRVHPDLAGRDRVLEVAQAFEPAGSLERLPHALEVAQAFEPAGSLERPPHALEVAQAFEPAGSLERLPHAEGQT